MPKPESSPSGLSLRRMLALIRKEFLQLLRDRPTLAMVVMIPIIQVVLFGIAAPFIGLTPSLGGAFMLVLGFVLTGLGFTSLGFALAWSMRSTAGFHAIMMVFLMPLWMLSGALFPVTGAPVWMGWVMLVNPVYHALNIIRLPFYHDVLGLLSNGAWVTSLTVTVAWVALCLGVSMMRVERREKGA